MKYDVHIFALVRVKVAGVEADSQMNAIEAAEETLDMETLFASVPALPPATEVEFTGQIVECLVDADSFNAVFKRMTDPNGELWKGAYWASIPLEMVLVVTAARMGITAPSGLSLPAATRAATDADGAWASAKPAIAVAAMSPASPNHSLQARDITSTTDSAAARPMAVLRLKALPVGVDAGMSWCMTLAMNNRPYNTAVTPEARRGISIALSAGWLVVARIAVKSRMVATVDSTAPATAGRRSAGVRTARAPPEIAWNRRCQAVLHNL